MDFVVESIHETNSNAHQNQIRNNFIDKTIVYKSIWNHSLFGSNLSFYMLLFWHLLNVLQILYKDLVDHEAEIKDLLRQCDSTLESIPPSKEKQDLQDKAEEIRAEFDELKLCALERDQKLEASMRHAQCFQDMLDKQLLWLQFSQDKLEGFQPTELQRDVIAKKLSDAQVCRSNI